METYIISLGLAIINPAIYGNGFHGSVLLNDSCMAVTDADLFTLGTCTKKTVPSYY